MSSQLSNSILSTLSLSHTHIHWISLWRMPRSLSPTPGKELDLVAVQILQLWQWHNITGPPRLLHRALPTKFSKSLLFLVLCLLACQQLFLSLGCLHTILKVFFAIIESSRKLDQLWFLKCFWSASFLGGRGICAPKTKMVTIRVFGPPHSPLLNLL